MAVADVNEPELHTDVAVAVVVVVLITGQLAAIRIWAQIVAVLVAMVIEEALEGQFQF